MTGALLVRTLLADTETELRRLASQEAAKGWRAIGNPGRLLVGGKPAEGKSWVWHMEKRA
jgi:hypothetical protein